MLWGECRRSCVFRHSSMMLTRSLAELDGNVGGAAASVLEIEADEEPTLRRILTVGGRQRDAAARRLARREQLVPGRSWFTGCARMKPHSKQMIARRLCGRDGVLQLRRALVVGQLDGRA